jgi:transglutaminase-like putative cysteine protease
MKIRAGYEISYDCPQPTPMILTLSVHPSRFSDLLTLDRMRLDPPILSNTYHDSFGNFCHVIRAPGGRLTVSADFLVQDSGEPDATAPQAEQHALEDLPVEVLIFLLGSRYCETDRLSNTAWSLFGQIPKGWPLVKAICDYVHARIKFGYQHASPTKTAWDAHSEQRGVCRDFAHLSITLCRCMNLPARYCTGYLGDVSDRGGGRRFLPQQVWKLGEIHRHTPRLVAGQPIGSRAALRLVVEIEMAERLAASLTMTVAGSLGANHRADR